MDAGQISAPWLEPRLVEGIAFGPNLEEDRVQTGSLGGIEQSNGFRFLSGFGQALFGREIDVVDAGDPSAPHFRMDFG